ncbi:hypothetical protein [Arenimonas composti]|uniref:Band 7 domain-containing protein n=1 Tax=Arenimonas composti TR7-09 = DSM 18010 TaxID=1121013 RepID=A0A091BFQ9_9GAMM|nr:hypothetical protein [Arenimonas composti]KFN50571.1 hypothetical protein P873_05270 [Arenimonas composti TR7-09 = DSM 18010]
MNISALLPDASSPLSTLSWLTGLRRVADNTAVSVRRLGRFHRALGPGWHWTLPAVEQVGAPVALTGHRLHIGAADARAELYYQILDPAQVGPDLDVVDDFVAAEAAAALANLPAHRRTDELLKEAVNLRLAGHGVRAIRCRLTA